MEKKLKRAELEHERCLYRSIKEYKAKAFYILRNRINHFSAYGHPEFFARYSFGGLEDSYESLERADFLGMGYLVYKEDERKKFSYTPIGRPVLIRRMGDDYLLNSLRYYRHKLKGLKDKIVFEALKFDSPVIPYKNRNWFNKIAVLTELLDTEVSLRNLRLKYDYNVNIKNLLNDKI